MSSETPSQKIEQDTEESITRRDALAAGAMMPLAFWEDWSIFNEEEQAEILRVLNSESPVGDGITQLDFGTNLSVKQTSETAARIDASGANSPWTEDSDGDIVPSDGQPVTVGEISVTSGHGLLDLPNHHINYGSGLSNEEIARFSLASGDVLELWRLESQLKGGGTNSNVTLDVYDATNGTVLGSVTAGNRSEGGSSPLGTSGAGATILVRLSTGSSSVDLCNSGLTSVVSQ